MVETWSPSRCVAVEAPGGGGQKQAPGSRVWEGAAGKVARAITTPTPLQNTEKDCTRLHARQMLSACKCNHSVGQKMSGLDLGSGGETHGNSSSPFAPFPEFRLTRTDGAAFETRYSVSVPGGDNTTSERGRVGLCADCRYMRRVGSARGSTFYFCERSTIDPNFPKYPRLPVIQCSGHEPHISLLGNK